MLRIKILDFISRGEWLRYGLQIRTSRWYLNDYKVIRFFYLQLFPQVIHFQHL